jgi:hypothetical protein
MITAIDQENKIIMRVCSTQKLLNFENLCSATQMPFDLAFLYKILSSDQLLPSVLQSMPVVERSFRAESSIQCRVVFTRGNMTKRNAGED